MVYLSHLPWSRNDPGRVTRVQSFDRLGGWFLFSAPKVSGSDDGKRQAAHKTPRLI
jgi:hypothetical protein